MLCFRANAVIEAAQRDADNSLILAGRNTSESSLLSAATLALAREPAADWGSDIADYASEIARIEEQLNQLFTSPAAAAASAEERSRFYVNLNRMALLWDSLQDCKAASQRVNWTDLQQSRF